ncbi:DUF4845 domain-containing protein [Aquabacterium sp. A7-Y]|uniref:DUF4845 domain-containing protein n=1 Tax=Aquabacterium sp. A7-Y TaxID=1349605 RepID=UPI00223E4D1E|nr:DUF4845 domain-containing protein [Aquabacterium sp. A7-Y]MCW7541809.1 DUF4845 domain-containing protein [Aquabacterium sp. A7-Y]
MAQIPRSRQRGVTLLGLLFWAIVIGSIALVGMKVFPTLTEYWAIQRAVHKVAQEGGTSVPEIRAAFDRQRDIDYGVEAISGKDLEVTKVNDKVVVRFAYDKEVELVEPVYLLIKYSGSSE